MRRGAISLTNSLVLCTKLLRGNTFLMEQVQSRYKLSHSEYQITQWEYLFH